jgi:hypothetical protein
MKDDKKIVLRQDESEPGAAYVELHDHPHADRPSLVARSVDIHSLIENFSGPRICVDFNHHGVAVGIEIVYPTNED